MTNWILHLNLHWDILFLRNFGKLEWQIKLLEIKVVDSLMRKVLKFCMSREKLKSFKNLRTLFFTNKFVGIFMTIDAIWFYFCSCKLLKLFSKVLWRFKNKLFSATRNWSIKNLQHWIEHKKYLSNNTSFKFPNKNFKDKFKENLSFFR
jgi:hypothetical protein